MDRELFIHPRLRRYSAATWDQVFHLISDDPTGIYSTIIRKHSFRRFHSDECVRDARQEFAVHLFIKFSADTGAGLSFFNSPECQFYACGWSWRNYASNSGRSVRQELTNGRVNDQYLADLVDSEGLELDPMDPAPLPDEGIPPRNVRGSDPDVLRWLIERTTHFDRFTDTEKHWYLSFLSIIAEEGDRPTIKRMAALHNVTPKRMRRVIVGMGQILKQRIELLNNT
jgi:hypothetical protein